MTFTVVSDPGTWDDFLNGFAPELRDVYFRSWYLRIYEANGDGIACAALYTGTRGTRILYPFLKVPLAASATEAPSSSTGGRLHGANPSLAAASRPDGDVLAGLSSRDGDVLADLWDVSSAYGYGGPLVERPDPHDLADFEMAWAEWCVRGGIVSEFVRFHPLLGNERWLQHNLLCERNRETVVIDLRPGYDEIFRNSFTKKTRNLVRKGEKLGLVAGLSRDVDTFAALYRQTMQRVGAPGYYFFSPASFAALSRAPETEARLFEVRHEGNVAAMAWILGTPPCLHYHLAASDEAMRACTPNDFLIAQIVAWGCRQGFTTLHLGGGTSARPDDSLLRFKTGFSPRRAIFCIGKRVHDAARHVWLLADWSRRTGQEPRLFQHYQQKD